MFVLYHWHFEHNQGSDNSAAFFHPLSFLFLLPTEPSFHWQKQTSSFPRNNKKVFHQNDPWLQKVFSLFIPNGKGKHAVKICKAIFFPVIISGENNFGIGFSTETGNPFL